MLDGLTHREDEGFANPGPFGGDGFDLLTKPARRERLEHDSRAEGIRGIALVDLEHDGKVFQSQLDQLVEERGEVLGGARKPFAGRIGDKDEDVRARSTNVRRRLASSF